MVSFSPSEAAIEGFRQTWERPLAAVFWGVVRFIASLAALAAFITEGGAQTARAVAAAGDPASLTPQAASVLMAHAAPAILFFFLINLAGYAIIYAAVLRAILTPGARRLGGLRLSRDEGLQFVLALIVLALVLGFALVSTVLVSLAATLPAPLSALLRPLLAAASVAGLFAILVRLSLAPAATFSAGKLRVFSTIPLTRGAFWPIATTYLLATVLSLVVVLLAVVIFFLIVGAIGLAQGGVAGLPDALKFVQANPATVVELLGPRSLINLVFDSALATLAYILLMAPGAAVFRALSGARAAEPAAKAAPGAPWG